MCLNYPETLPSTLVHGKTVFHETGPCATKRLWTADRGCPLMRAEGSLQPWQEHNVDTLVCSAGPWPS